MDSEDAKEFAEYLNELSAKFDELCQDRSVGTFTFLGEDVIQQMIEELADTANLARQQAVKLMMLQEQLEQDKAVIGFAKTAGEAGDVVEIEIGHNAFKSTKDLGWEKRDGSGN